MEELKILVSMVANLPNTALWVIAFLFAYKVSIVGSIYGVIRLAIQRLYEWGTSPNRYTATQIIRQEIHLEDLLNGITISGDDTKISLIALLKSFASNNTYHKGIYIHLGHVDWLREAIADKYVKDTENI